MSLPKEHGFVNLLIITIAVLILVSAGAYILLKPRVNSTVSLFKLSPTPLTVQVYNDQTLKFRFHYNPQLFTVTEETEETYSKRGFTDYHRNFAGYVGYQPPSFIKGLVLSESSASGLDKFENAPLSLWTFDNPEKLSINAWYKNYWYYPFNWGEFSEPNKSNLSPTQDITVAGMEGKFGIVLFQPNSPKYIYLEKDSRVYLFRVFTTNHSEGEAILKTLEFY